MVLGGRTAGKRETGNGKRETEIGNWGGSANLSLYRALGANRRRFVRTAAKGDIHRRPASMSNRRGNQKKPGPKHKNVVGFTRDKWGTNEHHKKIAAAPVGAVGPTEP